MIVKGVIKEINIDEQCITIKIEDELKTYYYMSDFFNNKEYIYPSMFECKPLYFDVDGKVVREFLS